MENEDGYMISKFKNCLKSRQRSKDFSLYPKFYCLLLVLGFIEILIFMIAVNGLKFWDKKQGFPKNVNISSLAGNNSKCLNGWLLNKRKCYWLSTSFKTWKESRHDCTKLQEHLLVIQNLDELGFIQNSLKSGYFSWVCLYITSQGNHFSMIGLTANKSRAIVIGKHVYSEECNSKFNGICQRQAVFPTPSRTSGDELITKCRDTLQFNTEADVKDLIVLGKVSNGKFLRQDIIIINKKLFLQN
ncbi:killer cell lectin-like receptor subfamily F member 2 [Tamandua tetradactyla]|uniref:killer cell lectin-like receptor subfamily F member 2 n=1 Tax=Tamandua tetradactyla TaxID=48850 RepID=UPI004053FEA5